MAAFKKSFLVLAVVLLALAGASTANAQHPSLLTCTATSVPATARAEGIAEILGDIIATCVFPAGATSTLPSFVSNIGVTLNVNVTNNRDFSAGGEVTDAILETNGVLGTPTAASTLSGIPNTPFPQYGTRVSPNRLEWNGAILPTPGVSGTGFTNPSVLQIRITNMRGNVSQLGIPSGEGVFPSAQVTAFLQISSPTAIPVTNNVVNVGVPLLGLLTRFRGPNQADVTLPIVALQCFTQHLDSDSNITVNPDGTGGNAATGDRPRSITGGAGAPGPFGVGSFSVRLSEGFASAFKTLGVPTTTPAQALGESGYPTPPSNGGGGATQGTRFLLRFFNVPSGVRLATPTRIRSVEALPASGHRLELFKVSGTDASGAGALGAITTSPPVEVPISSGFGFVVYEVVDSNPFAVENVVVPVIVASRANTTSDLPAVGTLQMSATFAPISTVTTASASAPEPRFVDTSSPRSMFSITRCATTLLYPFVTNQAGFDTGFSIANTTRDPFGTSQSAGSCTLNYFGGTTGGGAAPAPQTSSTVGAGSHIVWTLSGGNAAAGITGTPGFQGYIIAVCQFPLAHGFAFITDGFGGVPAIAEGYLALVLDRQERIGAGLGVLIPENRAH